MGLFSGLLKDPNMKSTLSLILGVLVIIFLYLSYGRKKREGMFKAAQQQQIAARRQQQQQKAQQLKAQQLKAQQQQAQAGSGATPKPGVLKRMGVRVNNFFKNPPANIGGASTSADGQQVLQPPPQPPPQPNKQLTQNKIDTKHQRAIEKAYNARLTAAAREKAGNTMESAKMGGEYGPDVQDAAMMAARATWRKQEQKLVGLKLERSANAATTPEQQKEQRTALMRIRAATIKKKKPTTSAGEDLDVDDDEDDDEDDFYQTRDPYMGKDYTSVYSAPAIPSRNLKPISSAVDGATSVMSGTGGAVDSLGFGVDIADAGTSTGMYGAVPAAASMAQKYPNTPYTGNDPDGLWS